HHRQWPMRNSKKVDGETGMLLGSKPYPILNENSLLTVHGMNTDGWVYRIVDYRVFQG
ncbi:hypothetical protein SERLADRAFT_391341, partial [Serpula lacrymans var. lacrymans S7.9]